MVTVEIHPGAESFAFSNVKLTALRTYEAVDQVFGVACYPFIGGNSFSVLECDRLSF